MASPRTAERPTRTRSRLLTVLFRLPAKLWPAPRRPLGWSAWWPLLAVAVAGGGGMALAIGLHRLRLAEPWQLLWLLLLPWVWWMHAAGWGGLGRWRGSCATLVRMLLILAVVLALAGVRAVRSSDQLSVVYALDCSDSIGDPGTDQAVRWITTTAAGKPAHDAAGLVVFGRDAAVEIPPRQAFVYDAISSRLARDGTDIENALELAGATLPEEGPGRIVLISDGTATQGDVTRAVDQLAARHVPVDVLEVSYPHPEEVWLERLDLPRQVHEQQTYEAGIVLGSLMAGKGTLVLTENGREIARQGVSYGAGMSRYSVPLTLRQAGYYQYVATIEPEPGHDGWTQNNTVLGAISLQGKGHVLLVHGDGAEPREWQPLAQALRESGRAVEDAPASSLPEDPQALVDCEAVALVDVPSEALTESQQLALRDAVQDLGTGLVMVGGQNSFGPGGWNHTPVEEALPVSMDANERKVMPKGALAIILEMCEFENGDGWAKTITKKAVQVLSRRDDVGVLTYGYGRDDGGDHWILPMQPVGDYRQMAQKIDGADLGDMPSFDSIMRLALEGLKADNAAAKHLLLISDGDCGPPSPELLTEYAHEGIPVSTVLIVPMGDEANELLKRIAAVTGGRYYYPSSPSQLPAIFIKEAKTIRRSELQNIDFTPRVSFPSPILKELGALPVLHGYTLATPKPHAQVVLRGPDPDTEDPVLAVWRFGTGAAAAWTSDLSGNWAASWVGWPRFRAFVDQLFAAVSREEAPSSIALTVEDEDGQGVIDIEDHASGTDFLAVSARVSDPAGAASVIEVPQVAPGRYRATFPLSGVGRYLVGVSAAGGDQQERHEHVLSSLMVSYSDEYRRFRANPQVLQEIARRTGGRVLSAETDGKALFTAERAPVYRTRPVVDWALALAALLLPLDIALRRVSVDVPALIAQLAFWRRRRDEASSSTMGALLGRKAALGLPAAEGLPALRARLAPAAGTTAIPAVPAAAAKPKQVPATATAKATPGVPAPAGDTTSRLLEARRKREQERT